MSDGCEHCYIIDDSDENLLLDDENTKIRQKCVRCRKWLIKNVNTVEEQIEVPEDSPLLINELYRETLDEFHCHDSLVIHDDSKTWKKLATVCVLCFLFMIAEIVGGYIAGSLAVMTDAAHLFSDLVGFLISLLSIWIGWKPPSKRMTFGYHRAEVIGALLSVLTIWLLAILFSVLALNRLWKPEHKINADYMLIISSLGLIVNIIMGASLHGVCHTHSHHGPAASPTTPANDNNINVRAAAAHVLGDILQSLGVLIAAIIIKIYPNAQLADPICTLIFTVIVICTTAKVGRDSLWFLLEGSPINSVLVLRQLRNVPGVRHVHSLRIWSLAPGRDAVAVHLAVDRFCDRDLVLKIATAVVRSQISVVSCTIQVEVYNAELINCCKHCQC